MLFLLWLLVFISFIERLFPPVNINNLPLNSFSTFRVFFFLNKFIYLFIFGCIGSSLLRAGFL